MVIRNLRYILIDEIFFFEDFFKDDVKVNIKKRKSFYIY